MTNFTKRITFGLSGCLLAFTFVCALAAIFDLLPSPTKPTAIKEDLTPQIMPVTPILPAGPLRPSAPSAQDETPHRSQPTIKSAKKAPLQNNCPQLGNFPTPEQVDACEAFLRVHPYLDGVGGNGKRKKIQPQPAPSISDPWLPFRLPKGSQGW
jgi:hypothetical protein